LTLIGGDTFTGALTRAVGEDVGTYAITQGTLALSTNYTIAFTGADFDITPLSQ
jgi:large repetitive protein